MSVKELYERNIRKLFQHFVDGYNLTFLVVGTTPLNARMLLMGAKKERIPVGIIVVWHWQIYVYSRTLTSPSTTLLYY